MVRKISLLLSLFFKESFSQSSLEFDNWVIAKLASHMIEVMIRAFLVEIDEFLTVFFVFFFLKFLAFLLKTLLVFHSFRHNYSLIDFVMMIIHFFLHCNLARAQALKNWFFFVLQVWKSKKWWIYKK